MERTKRKVVKGFFWRKFSGNEGYESSKSDQGGDNEDEANGDKIEGDKIRKYE